MDLSHEFRLLSQKRIGSFLFAEAPDAFLWPQPESSGNYMQKQPNMWMSCEKKNTGSSTKTALYVDELRKNEGLSTKTALYVDELRKNTGSSTETALYVDECS